MRTLVCPRCNGKGKSVSFREREHIYMSWYTWQECPACKGTGYNTIRLDATNERAPLFTDAMVTLTACLGIPQPKSATTIPATRLTTIKL